MRNLLGILFLLSIGATLILFVVSLCNYLIAYQTSGIEVKDAVMNNVYVRYWVYLLAFFVAMTVISFLGFLVMKPKVYDDEGMQVYENQRGVGNGPVDEYVTVRVKRDDLSKLQT
ncbi:hypothetical protein [Ornithinibacillus scapharcae]|uniref:hypothetical protein n=1 Tax=Ornithinibacillus scapharcae TaxID=1147159 RepID=UPI000225AAD3|nr:hypothetical protein [Ornithinibacillus scapharcae]